MVELSGRSPGVSTREIDLTGPQNVLPTGVPAGIIGTADRGPAFVPVTFATIQDFVTRFSNSDGTKFGPIAVSEWLRNAQAATYLRVLGVGKGLKRETSGDNAGRVLGAGFVVGSELPLENGFLGENRNAAAGGPLGRTHLLGCFMSESAGSTIFSEAGIQNSNIAHPVLRGIIFAPSGVVLTLDTGTSLTPATVAGTANVSGPNGGITGSVNLSNGNQTFVMLLNGHRNDDPSNPNIITASFDVTAPNYFGNIFNSDATKIQEAGHYLYAKYDIHPSFAVVTGSGITVAGAASANNIAILTTGSAARNDGSATVPSYENFEDRYTTPASPLIISQKFGGRHKDLFRIFLRSDGAEGNDNFKISIQNIAPSSVDDSQYGTFDLIVRDINDSDENRIILESFFGLTLDPGSDNYIARRIGDRHVFFDWDRSSASQKLVEEGKFPNRSNLIRVQVNTEVDDGEIDPTALPIGFRGPAHLVTSGSDPLTAISADADALVTAGNNAIKRMVEPPIPYRQTLAVGQDPKKVPNRQLYWGVQFERKVSLDEPNKSRVFNPTINSYSKYFPNFHTTFQNVSVGENAGAADESGTVLDSDRFNNNIFSLDKIKIRTGSNGTFDSKEIISMSYVRNGMIDVNDVEKTRGLDVATDFSDLTLRTLAKFNFFIQGGFDGVNIFNRDARNLTNRAIIEEMNDPARGQADGPTVVAYQRALDIIGNRSNVDIKLLAIPGIRHEVVTNKAVDVVENENFNAMFIMDIEERDNLNQVVTSSVEQDVNVTNTANAFSNRGLDTSFAAAYFPDVVMRNPFRNTSLVAPPSVVVLGAFSLNDSISFPWFAPAGFTRGALPTTERVNLNLSRQNLDILQDAVINPIVTFTGNTPKVFGQKTLLSAQSALDRVNVRRLLIEIRRQVREIGENLIFEPARESTLDRFSKLVQPRLERIQAQQGINRFRVLIDTTTTTEADILNNTIKGKIFVEPTKSIEFVSLDFVVTNPGSNF